MVTLHFVPYTDIEPLSSVGRIRHLLNIAKQNKIVLLQGRLRREEEAELIKTTMEEINKEFRGIELAVINPQQSELSGFSRMKYDVLGMLLGDRSGLTIIGPANVVKAISKDPNKIEVYTKDVKRKKRR
ncbi:MAG: DUF2073 domain-containing protein [Candidatus Aenigmarchaeota archaeon]|nr:DUF2073 domain-containing protein [Candidatus Aenigmarchaeota archaeon]